MPSPVKYVWSHEGHLGLRTNPNLKCNYVFKPYGPNEVFKRYRAVLLQWELRSFSSIDFKMILTPTKILHWVVGFLLPFYKIPQLIAQIWWICPFWSTPLSDPFIFINLRVRAEAAAAHLCPCCHSSILPPFEKTKWRSRKGPKSLNQRD